MLDVDLRQKKKMDMTEKAALKTELSELEKIVGSIKEILWNAGELWISEALVLKI